MEKTRIQQGVFILFTICMMLIVFAQWMDSRERHEQLQQFQTRIDALQERIGKLHSPIQPPPTR
jgi:CHASE3 domain sensor protein